jgi:hypothetical protein
VKPFDVKSPDRTGEENTQEKVFSTNTEVIIDFCQAQSEMGLGRSDDSASLDLILSHHFLWQSLSGCFSSYQSRYSMLESRPRHW